MKSREDIGRFRAAIGARYCSQSVSRFVNLSAPARNAVVPNVRRRRESNFRVDIGFSSRNGCRFPLRGGQSATKRTLWRLSVAPNCSRLSTTPCLLGGPDMSAPAMSPRTSSPSVLYVQGAEQRTIELEHTPFTIGRKTDKDLVIADSRVSRDHAQIISENGEYWVIDQGSRHGTYVNGIKRERQKLQTNDRIDFGARDGAYLIFGPDHPQSSAAAEFLSQISMMPL